MDVPRVSCVLATADRPDFLRQALRCFLRQTYPDRELIVVDDGAVLVEPLIPDDPRIRYVGLSRPRTLGAKLNCGVALATGELIQKLDDDDYYHPDFLAATAGALAGEGEGAVAACGSFLVLMAETGEVRRVGGGWFAGATLAFPRVLWARRPFRDVTKGEDWFFLEDHAPRRIALRRPELFMAVRHGRGHTWTRAGGHDVDAVFRRLPRYPTPLRTLVPPEALAFYEGLRLPHATPAPTPAARESRTAPKSFGRGQTQGLTECRVGS